MKRDWTSFVNGCASFGLAVDAAQTGQLECFYELLVQRNRQMNLTAITAFEEAKVLHFLDSLALGAFCKEEITGVSHIIDVGTGAGFPGMVLKILFPAWQVTLLDAQRKRTRFLEEAAETLGLSGVLVLHGRAEDFAKDPAHRERYDIACARAVSELRILAEYLLPFVKSGGFAAAYKTPDDGTELRDAEQAITVLGGGDVFADDYVLPDTDVKRRLVRIYKRSGTPDGYPRRAGIPEKRPL